METQTVQSRMKNVIFSFIRRVARPSLTTFGNIQPVFGIVNNRQENRSFFFGEQGTGAEGNGVVFADRGGTVRFFRGKVPFSLDISEKRNIFQGKTKPQQERQP